MDCTSTKSKLIIEDENEKEEDNIDAVYIFDESIPSTSHSTSLEKRTTSNIKNMQVIKKLMN